MNNKNKYIGTKALVFPAILFVMLLVISSCETDEEQTVTTLNNLVMSDEFDTEGAPNAAMWTYDIGRGPGNDGWGNQELQYYTNRTENIKVDNLRPSILCSVSLSLCMLADSLFAP